MIAVRRSGLLLHLTSLPKDRAGSRLGQSARDFVDWLVKAKQHYWQVLPLNPTEGIFGNSPYSSFSLFAGNTEFSGRSRLGWLDRKALADFCDNQAWWLDDFALFCVIKKMAGNKSWGWWSKEYKERDPQALSEVSRKRQAEIQKIKKTQFLFFQQWRELRQYCHERSVKIIGDLPIYPCYDSADVWANSGLFKLDADKRPLFAAGVPPDYFSRTGQLWGNAVYDWDKLKASRYQWWIKRIRRNLELFDLLRLDHFRGFVSYWEVPAGEQSAANGRWVKAPAADFLNVLKKKFPGRPLIAEDLGYITDEVKELMARFKFPGMKILLFAFNEDNPKHPYLPRNYTPECVVYTGTHDNNTVRGWFDTEASAEDKERLFKYLGGRIESADVSWELVKLAMESKANTAIIPVQDLLGLGAEARMNQPSQTQGNWQWQLETGALTPDLAGKLAELTKRTGRG